MADFRRQIVHQGNHCLKIVGLGLDLLTDFWLVMFQNGKENQGRDACGKSSVVQVAVHKEAHKNPAATPARMP